MGTLSASTVVVAVVVNRSPIFVAIIVLIVVDKDHDNDCDNDLLTRLLKHLPGDTYT